MRWPNFGAAAGFGGSLVILDPAGGGPGGPLPARVEGHTGFWGYDRHTREIDRSHKKSASQLVSYEHNAPSPCAYVCRLQPVGQPPFMTTTFAIHLMYIITTKATPYNTNQWLNPTTSMLQPTHRVGALAEEVLEAAVPLAASLLEVQTAGPVEEAPVVAHPQPPSRLHPMAYPAVAFLAALLVDQLQEVGPSGEDPEAAVPVVIPVVPESPSVPRRWVAFPAVHHAAVVHVVVALCLAEIQAEVLGAPCQGEPPGGRREARLKGGPEVVHRVGEALVGYPARPDPALLVAGLEEGDLLAGVPAVVARAVAEHLLRRMVEVQSVGVPVVVALEVAAYPLRRVEVQSAGVPVVVALAVAAHLLCRLLEVQSVAVLVVVAL